MADHIDIDALLARMTPRDEAFLRRFYGIGSDKSTLAKLGRELAADSTMTPRAILDRAKRRFMKKLFRLAAKS